MSDYTTSIGLDVHARSIKGCAFNPYTSEVERRSFPHGPAAVAGWVLSFEGARAVCESGVTGLRPCRELRALGVDCAMGAVSKMMRPAADRRVKTDRRDAELLAKQLAMHEVCEVHVPDEECEAARDLSRALADARDEVVAAKQRLSKFLLRHGHRHPNRTPDGRPPGTWTAAHWAWIEAVEMAEPAAAATMEYYVDRVRDAVEMEKGLEARVRALAEAPRWKPTVDALRCMKGVETVTAVALACEVDGFSRFRSASAFSAWLGVVPSESSSGERRSRGGITKAGNKHLRRPVVANMAVAREPACRCWAVGRMVESAA